jgi:ABC-type multidrug transport system fused ATPase/permease subunit
VIFTNTICYLRKVFFLVGADRRKLLLLLPLYLFSSAADVMGIGLLVALVSTLKSPDTLLQFASQIPFFEKHAASSSVDTLTVILSCALFVLYVLKTSISIYVNRLTLKITFLYGARLRSFLMGVYQALSYDRFIQRNSSEYLYTIQTMAGQFVSYTVQPILRIIGDGIVALLIIGYLAVKDPFVLASLLILIFIAGVLYDRAYRKKIASYGSQDNSLSATMIRSIMEGLTGYKESRIFGIERFFRQRVAESAFRLANSRVKSQVITTSSRYLLEFIVVISVISVIIATIAWGGDKQNLLTTIALFLVASMRLVPAANQIFTSLGNLRYGRHAVDVLYKDITDAGHVGKVDFETGFDVGSSTEMNDGETPFRYLEFQDVCFQYQSDSPWVLNSVNLRIERYDIVGVLGPSGSGKTTMIALMLGLLAPLKGKVSCDGRNLAHPQNIREWQKKVAYLPQEVFLIDDTVARNVALGVEEEEIDEVKLNAALAKARLAEMVERMPDGINSHIGERGLWISGGQRQRIALARAFYYDSEILIMDESTSALDSETAHEIISELRQLRGKVTIVVITHQEALLELCNKVYRLENGDASLLEYDAPADSHKK